MGNKKALIVGINYKGTGNDLRGCINDAINTKTMLTNIYGFTDITSLIETQATTAGMKAALEKFVTGNVPGDILYFHYSGHGSQLLDMNNDEADGVDEILCPYDLNWKDKVITDDQLKMYFDRVPAGVNLTVVFDCCHSGSALDQREEYEVRQDEIVAAQFGLKSEGSRFLPPPADMVEAISQRQLRVRPMSVARAVNNSALLITGCEEDQTSSDAYINGSYQGAATASIIKTINQSSNITYRQLVNKMNEFMVDNNFSQCPELNGPSNLYDNKFLEAFTNADSTTDPDPVYVAPPVVQPVVEEKKNNNVFIIVGAVAALAAVVFFLSH